jgi:signal transduction histidine kinase
MTQEVLKKIFDPFFTTKEKKGTGLGLSMVYNIIQQHKGFVEVYSEPGNGSVFNVFLPACQEADAEKPSKMG